MLELSLTCIYTNIEARVCTCQYSLHDEIPDLESAR